MSVPPYLHDVRKRLLWQRNQDVPLDKTHSRVGGHKEEAQIPAVQVPRVSHRITDSFSLQKISKNIESDL